MCARGQVFIFLFKYIWKYGTVLIHSEAWPNVFCEYISGKLFAVTPKSDETAPLQWSRFSSCLLIVITGNGLRSLSHNL
jgi:hypothetical protein